MLKSLWLSILGWFRTKAEANTDLRYAGKEQFARNEAAIENVRKQRQRIAREEAARQKAIDERNAAEAAAERKRKEKAEWDAMTPKQREAIAIKKLWVSPCKEWMCQN